MFPHRHLHRAVLRLFAILGLLAAAANAQDYKKQVIYQIITDRFFNGDTTNDNPSQSSGLFDSTKTNWQLYWGGDLAGIKQKMSYLSGMGVTAIWISPPVDNINVSIPDGNNNPTAPYHGYAARDMKRVEEHFGDSSNSWSGVDALRIDAVKHVTWGWEYSMVNSVFNNSPSFLFGEWFQGNTNDTLYHDSYKFANHSGMTLLDFPLNTAIRDVFAGNNNFSEIDTTLTTENTTFTWQNDLVTFIDNHDMPRFLSVNNNQNRYNEALAFLLTCRGIPTVYYGDEQYLYN